ncbi:MAG: hypothetical protein FK732_00715 [Asgard group archaeon]|nr:hypothetical protein [Asgard group archaeon]
MRMNKSFILLTIMIMLSPALSVMGTSVDKQIVPQAFDSSVGVVAGDTLYYNIDQLVLPPEVEPENVTLPDFADNTVYVKVMWVDDDYEFTPGVNGYFINYAVGLIFEEDETITVGDGLISTDYIIPAGAATPSIVVEGVPHWNFTFGGGPSLFFINNDYAEHATLLGAIGFTVTDTVDTFSATFVNGTGEISGTWRKSDGICTHLIYDDIYFMGQNFTGFTFEVSFNEKEYNPLPVTNGDVISFDVDIADISVDGTGDLYNELNQTILNSVTSEADSLVGETLMSVVVTEVRGCYYMADTYMYNFETGMLEKASEPTVFNGFFGSITTGDEPFYLEPSHGFSEGIAPAITPDWRIYEGYTILGDTIFGVYIDELMDAIDPPEDEIIFHSIEAGLELKEKRNFYYFQEAANVQIENNMTYGVIMPEAAYLAGAIYTAEQNGYLCYTDTGIGAAIYVRAVVDVEVYDDVGTDYDTGTLHVEVDFKIRNPNYNPPEIINNNILPGFTWFIAIPTIIGLAAIGAIVRRRR